MLRTIEASSPQAQVKTDSHLILASISYLSDSVFAESSIFSVEGFVESPLSSVHFRVPATLVYLAEGLQRSLEHEGNVFHLPNEGHRQYTIYRSKAFCILRIKDPLLRNCRSGNRPHVRMSKAVVTSFSKESQLPRSPSYWFSRYYPVP